MKKCLLSILALTLFGCGAEDVMSEDSDPMSPDETSALTQGIFRRRPIPQCGKSCPAGEFPISRSCDPNQCSNLSCGTEGYNKVSCAALPQNYWIDTCGSTCPAGSAFTYVSDRFCSSACGSSCNGPNYSNMSRCYDLSYSKIYIYGSSCPPGFNKTGAVLVANCSGNCTRLTCEKAAPMTDPPSAKWQCGTSCQSGYHVKELNCVAIDCGGFLACGNGYGGSGFNQALCEKDAGDSFFKCGEICPSGYKAKSYSCDIKCGTKACGIGSSGNNSAICIRSN